MESFGEFIGIGRNVARQGVGAQGGKILNERVPRKRGVPKEKTAGKKE